MIGDHVNELLYIEPTTPASAEPFIDHLTRRMACTLGHQVGEGPRYRGAHTCICGATSVNYDIIVQLRNGTSVQTNSLAVHYLAHHRDAISAEILAHLDAVLAQGQIEPTEAQLTGRRIPSIHVRVTRGG